MVQLGGLLLVGTLAIETLRYLALREELGKLAVLLLLTLHLGPCSLVGRLVWRLQVFELIVGVFAIRAVSLVLLTRSLVHSAVLRDLP